MTERTRARSQRHPAKMAASSSVLPSGCLASGWLQWREIWFCRDISRRQRQKREGLGSLGGPCKTRSRASSLVAQPARGSPWASQHSCSWKFKPCWNLGTFIYNEDEELMKPQVYPSWASMCSSEYIYIYIYIYDLVVSKIKATKGTELKTRYRQHHCGSEIIAQGHKWWYEAAILVGWNAHLSNTQIIIVVFFRILVVYFMCMLTQEPTIYSILRATNVYMWISTEPKNDFYFYPKPMSKRKQQMLVVK